MIHYLLNYTFLLLLSLQTVSAKNIAKVILLPRTSDIIWLEDYSQKTSDNTELVLQCNARSRNIFWSIPNESKSFFCPFSGCILPELRITPSLRSGDGFQSILRIPRPETHHAGLYSCADGKSEAAASVSLEGRVRRSELSRLQSLGEGATMELSAGETLRLRCSADYPVTWIPVDNEGIEDWTASGQRERLSISTSPSGLESELSLRDVKFYDTGAYVCRDSLNRTATSTYVFVPDAVHLFLHTANRTPYGSVVAWKEYSDSYVPCRVTDPTLLLKLVINGETISSEIYDPQKGFLIKRYSLEISSVSAKGSCVAEKIGNRYAKDTFNFVLYIIKKTNDEPLTVSLNATEGRYAYKGGAMNLTAEMRTVNSGTTNCKWEYPSAAKTRVTLGKPVMGTVDGRSVTLYWLHVSALEVEDGGLYRISCTSIDANPASAEATIIVSATRGQVKLFASKSAPAAGVDEKASVRMSLDFISWPPSDTNISWFHVYTEPLKETETRVRIVSDDRHSLSVRQADGRTDGFVPGDEGPQRSAILDIHSSDVTDTGAYSVVISVGDAVKRHEFRLQVQSDGPNARLRVVKRGNVTQDVDPRFLQYSENDKYSIVCEGVGLPYPIVSLESKPCIPGYPPGADDCGFTRAANAVYEDGSFSRVALIDHNTFEPHTYRCTATIGSRQASEALEVIVTDVPKAEGGQGMRVTLAHVRNGADGNPDRVYADDDILLSCQAQRFSLQELSWYKFGPDNALQLLGNEYGHHENGYNLHIIRTPYSKTLQLNFTHIQAADSTTYECHANLANVDGSISSPPNVVTKRMKIVVLPLDKPSFDADTSEPAVTVNYSLPFALHCEAYGSPAPTLTWYKDGKLLRVHVSSGKVLSKDGRWLNVTRAVREDAGLYSCLALNRVGSITRNITVTVDNLPSDTVLSKTGIAALSAGLIILAFIILALIICLCLFWRRGKKQAKQLSDLYASFKKYSGELVPGVLPAKIDKNRPLNSQVENLPYDRRYEIPRDLLTLGSILGRGQFGVVQQGVLSKPKTGAVASVAVKLPKNGRSPADQKVLLDELRIMIHIGRHPNVLALVGAVTKHIVKGELYVVVELCELGCLQDLLKKNRPTFVSEIVSAPPSPANSPSRESEPLVQDGYLLPNQVLGLPTPTPTRYQGEEDARWSEQVEGDSAFLTTSDLLSFSAQAANGMDYLAKRNIIHRDLAARNLLLNSDRVVKIADFGLAREDPNYHIEKSRHIPLPIKWMALESILDQDYTVKSDVWSFGVVLWEMFSLGAAPYPSLPLDETFVNFLRLGHRLEQPPHAPREIFELMRECWLVNPEERPGFAECRERLMAELGRSSPQSCERMWNVFSLHATLLSRRRAESSGVDSLSLSSAGSGDGLLPVYYNTTTPFIHDIPRGSLRSSGDKRPVNESVSYATLRREDEASADYLSPNSTLV